MSSNQITIRNFESPDIEALQELYRVCFNEPSPPKPHFLNAYDADLVTHDAPASLVCERDNKIIGFLGVTYTAFRYRDKQLLGAVTSKFMVHPNDQHSMAAVKMLKQVFAGPQDFTFSDLVNGSARQVWTAMGAKVSWLNSMNWRYQRRRWSSIASAARKLLKPSSGHGRNHRAGDIGAAAALTSVAAELDDLLPTINRFPQSHTIQPHHTDTGLRRSLALLAHNHENGQIRFSTTIDVQKSPLGWFAYHTNWHNQALVLGMGAERGHHRAVFESLLANASRGGRAVTGWLQPGLLDVISEMGKVTLRPRGYWTMVHSRNAGIVDEFVKGEASVGPLDGECPFSYRR